MSVEIRAWTCWRCDAVNDRVATACEQCGAVNRQPGAEPTAPSCEHCRATGHLNTFHDDGAEQDRGKRLCASCWVGALRRRAELDPIDPAERRLCLAEIARCASRFPSARTGAAGGTGVPF